MMRSHLEDNNARNTIFRSFRYGVYRKSISSAFAIPSDSPVLVVLTPSSDLDVTLPDFEDGRVLIIHNTSADYNLSVYDSDGVLVETLGTESISHFYGGVSSWSTSLSTFGNAVRYDVSQSKTVAEKLRARTNAGFPTATNGQLWVGQTGDDPDAVTLSGDATLNASGVVVVASATGGFSVLGGTLALGANSLTMTGSIGATGARVTKGWFTDLEVTNVIVGSISGNAATVTTNANLTGPITSMGNTTAVAAQTGTGSTFVMQASPTLTTPVISGGTIDNAAIGGTTPAAGTFTAVGINADSPAALFQVERTTVGGKAMIQSVFAGGDSAFWYETDEASSWLQGIDNADGDAWKLSFGSAQDAAFGVNDFFEVSTAGVVTLSALTASRLLATDASKQLVNTITSANLKSSISDALGSASGKAIFAEGTLAIAASKTLTASNTLTFTGTDGTSFALPSTSSTIATLAAANTFTAAQTISADTPGSLFRVERTTAGAVAMLRSSFAGGDAAFWYETDEASSWLQGVDNGDSDSWKLSFGAAQDAAFGVNDYVKVLTTGEVALSSLTASRLTATNASKQLVSTITAANLLASVTGTIGTGDLVFATALDCVPAIDYVTDDDGVSNQATAIGTWLAAAHAAGLWADGQGLIIGHNGTITVSSLAGLKIRNVTFKRRNVWTTSTADYMMYGANMAAGITLENIKFDVNGSTTTVAGELNRWKALYLEGCGEGTVVLRNVEVTGDTNSYFSGSGVHLENCPGAVVDNLYVHDLQYDATAYAVGTDQLHALWLTNSDRVRTNGVRASRLGHDDQTANTRDDNSRIIAVAGCRDCILTDTVGYRCGQGIDVTGSYLSSGIQVNGGSFSHMFSTAVKFSNSSVACKATGVDAEHCGKWPFLVAGADAGSNEHNLSQDNQFVNCTARNTGSSGVYNRTTETMGFACNANQNYPRNTLFSACLAISDVGSCEFGRVDSDTFEQTTATGDGMKFSTGVRCQLTTSAADLPAGLSTGTDYFLIVEPTNTPNDLQRFSLASSYINAQDGTAVSTSDAGTGTHTLTLFQDMAYGFRDEVGNNAGNGSLNRHANCNVIGAVTTAYSGFVMNTETPELTFPTVGNLAVTYSDQVLFWERDGAFITVTFRVTTSSWTHDGSPSGALRLTGLPVAAENTADMFWIGSCQFQGITKAGYTQIVPRISLNQNYIEFPASGSGQTISSVSDADMPTGGSVSIIGTIRYRAAA